MGTKNYSDFSRDEQANFEEYVNRVNNHYLDQINLNARILTNWLYALSTTGLGAVYYILKTGNCLSLLIMSAKLFFISLLLCILSTAIEWWRFSDGLNIFLRAHEEFITDKSNREKFSESINKRREKDTKFLIAVFCLKAGGYVTVLGGIFYLFRYFKDEYSYVI